MAKLNARARKQIKPSNFASPKGQGSDPGKDQYPIHDRSHAQNALSQVQKHGTAAEKRKVRAAVARKYPTLGKNKK